MSLHYHKYYFTLFLAGTEIALNTSSLVFEMANERLCATVSVADRDTVAMGSHSYQLVLNPPSPGTSSVPVLVYPNTVPIIVIDNDGPGKQAI